MLKSTRTTFIASDPPRRCLPSPGRALVRRRRTGDQHESDSGFCGPAPGTRGDLMPKPEKVDVLVPDSGQGGRPLPWHRVRSRQHTARVERQSVDGSCPAVRYIASKNEIWSAGLARLAQIPNHFPNHCGMLTGLLSTHMAKVLSRKQASRERILLRAWEIATGIAKPLPLTASYTRVALTQPLRRPIDESLCSWLALEGSSAADVARGASDGGPDAPGRS